MQGETVNLGSYDVLLFDVDGVLLDVRGVGRERYLNMIEAALAAHDLPTDEATRNLFLGHEEVAEIQKRCEAANVSFENFWLTKETVEAQLQIDCVDMGDIVPYDDLTVLDALSSRHSLGIVSNNQQRIIDYALDTETLPTVFDAVYGRNHTINDLDRMKPSPDLIEAALADLNGGESLFVGDTKTDIMAAHRADIDVAWLTRDGFNLPSSIPEPTYRIDSLFALTSPSN